jgi:hypothetical protein
MREVVKITILFTLIFTFGCKKEDPTPVPPEITFIDAQLSVDKLYSIINFEFFDGDGDLGLKQEENSGDQEYNVFVDYYELNNGVWELKSPIIDTIWNDTLVPPGWDYPTQYFHVRMPYIENEAKLSLQGDINVHLFYNNFKFAQTPKLDTFRYEIYIKDRALHSSNVITTSDIIVD